jgi:hypothetical protein
MSLTSTKALRLFAELMEFDEMVRKRRQPLTLAQKQRRAAIMMDLHRWALDRQRSSRPGAEQRRDPRASVRLRTQMIGGPRPIELETDSLAVGGIRAVVNFAPRVGDVLALRLLPLEEAPVEVMAKVVWFDAVRSKAGLSFVDVSSETRELVERLVYSDLIRSG